LPASAGGTDRAIEPPSSGLRRFGASLARDHLRHLASAFETVGRLSPSYFAAWLTLALSRSPRTSPQVEVEFPEVHPQPSLSPIRHGPNGNRLILGRLMAAIRIKNFLDKNQ
jgi:hypothetical protein